MRICIHNGSKQIGGSCVEIESRGHRLLIDFGLPLDADANEVDYFKNIHGLDGTDPNLLGVLVSHPHLDHFGLLSFMSPQIPVGMGPAARRILTAAAPFLPKIWQAPPNGWDYQSGRSFDAGNFKVTPYLVDHSAYDAYALLIESDNKRIFYSGDFRAHGRKSALFEKLIANPPDKVDVLFLEGSSIGRLNDDQHFPTEKDVEAKLIHAFSSARGLAMVHASSQNIDRIVSIYRASRQTGRRIVIDLYTAAVLEATGNRKIPQSFWPDIFLFVPQPQRIQIKKNESFDLLRRHSSNRIFIEHIQKNAGKTTLLFRPLHRFDLEAGNCLQDAVYIYSQWEGYWNRGDYSMVESWLAKHSISKLNIHTSGHASPGDLKRLADAMNPHTIVPIHSFMPERYPELFQNVNFHSDGEWWNV